MDPGDAVSSPIVGAGPRRHDAGLPETRRLLHDEFGGPKGESRVSELVVTVDGMVPRERAHREGIPHYCVHLVVFGAGDGIVYLQQRSRNVDISPGLLDSTVSGHVNPSDLLDKGLAATGARVTVREAEEELGVSLAPEVVEFRGEVEAVVRTGERICVGRTLVYTAVLDLSPEIHTSEVERLVPVEVPVIDRIVESGGGAVPGGFELTSSFVAVWKFLRGLS